MLLYLESIRSMSPCARASATWTWSYCWLFWRTAASESPSTVSHRTLPDPNPSPLHFILRCIRQRESLGGVRQVLPAADCGSVGGGQGSLQLRQGHGRSAGRQGPAPAGRPAGATAQRAPQRGTVMICRYYSLVSMTIYFHRSLGRS